jgi:hypothetical protein
MMTRKKLSNISSGFDGVDVNFLGSRDEPAEERTVESRDKLRSSLQKQVDSFIKKGGKITEVSNIYSQKQQQNDNTSASA